MERPVCERRAAVLDGVVRYGGRKGAIRRAPTLEQINSVSRHGNRPSHAVCEALKER